MGAGVRLALLALSVLLAAKNPVTSNPGLRIKPAHPTDKPMADIVNKYALRKSNGDAGHISDKKMRVMSTFSGKKAVAVTLNHEGLKKDEFLPACAQITKVTALPAFDVLKFGSGQLITLLRTHVK